MERWNDGSRKYRNGGILGRSEPFDPSTSSGQAGSGLEAGVQESVARRPKNDVRVEDRLFYHSSNYSSGGRILRRPGSAVIIAPDCSSLPYFAIILMHIDPCSLAAILTRRRIPE